MYPDLINYIEKAGKIDITAERKAILNELIAYIQKKLENGDSVRLNFICTHNSRRSHLTMIWAAAMAAYFKTKDVKTFSGGTEATAFNPRAVKAIENAGFKVIKPGGENPKYEIFFDEGAEPMICYSKRYDDLSNGSEKFAAIMTCSHADDNCPYIPSADARIPVRYQDPKAFDDTPEESEKYAERCLQIASEMYYVFEELNQSKR